jgi:seryl-tRNA synthetase
MCNLSSDADQILDFSNHIGDGKPNPKLLTYLDPPQQMCRSAICLSSYPQFAGKTLATSDYETWTTFGKAFRNEASNVTSLERLYEFSMREIIYFGDRDFVAQRLTACLDWFKTIMSEWNLCGNIQTANDPFFAEKIQALQFYQLAEQSKFEIRWWNPTSGNNVSVGSINNHGNHFSKAYKIRLSDGQFATTGCVGFGFERLIFLFLSQFGLNPQIWPSAAKDFWDI